MKICKKCNRSKPDTSFYTHPQTRDGLEGSCKACRRKVTGHREALAQIGYKKCKICHCVSHKRNFGEMMTCLGCEERLAAGMKWCPACKLFKYPIMFHKDCTRNDGLASSCKLCKRGKISFL